MCSGSRVQLVLSADWFGALQRVCQTAERHCAEISAGRQSEGTHTHTLSTVCHVVVHCLMSAARLLLQVLHTDVCQQNILLQNTDVLIMNNVFEFFMEPNEQVRSGYKTHTPTCTDLFEQLMLAIHFLQNDAGNDITISSHNKFLNILIQSMAFHHGELQEARSSASHSSQSAGEPGCSAGEKTHTHTDTHKYTYLFWS